MRNILKSKIRSIKSKTLGTFAKPSIALLYHRIGPNAENDINQLTVTQENFHDQLSIILKDNDIRAIANIKKSSCVAITFDDGYLDNLEYALPVLEELQVSATFFISSLYTKSTQEFWWDELEEIANQIHGRKLTELVLFGEVHSLFSLKTAHSIYQLIHKIFRKLKYTEIEIGLNEICNQLNISRIVRTSNLAMNPSQLLKFSSSSFVEIGAHTSTHSRLSSLSLPEQKKEILDSIENLENIIGKKILSFAYPFGSKEDYNSDTIKILKDVGIEVAASNFAGQIYPWTSNYELPRFLVRNWNKEEFKNKINSFWKF